MKNFLTRKNQDDNWGLGFFSNPFEDFFKTDFFFNRSVMKTDVKEDENGYEIKVDIPGVEKENISLELDNGYLTVSVKAEEKSENERYVRRERSFYGNRSYYVGDSVTEEDVKAKYYNGTLSILIPKKENVKPEKKNIVID